MGRREELEISLINGFTYKEIGKPRNHHNNILIEIVGGGLLKHESGTEFILARSCGVKELNIKGSQRGITSCCTYYLIVYD